MNQQTWEEWCRDMEVASKDPLYLADQEEVMRDFEYADAEAARMIDEIDGLEREKSR